MQRHKARQLRQSSWWKRKIASGRCYYCQNTFHPSELCMDHIVPLSRGGTSEKSNIVPACKACNNQKKHRMPTDTLFEQLSRQAPAIN